MPSLAGQKILLWAVASFRQLQSAGWRTVQPRLDATLDLFLPLISPGKMIALEGEKAVPLSLIWMLPDVFRVISWEELIAEDPGFRLFSSLTSGGRQTGKATMQNLKQISSPLSRMRFSRASKLSGDTMERRFSSNWPIGALDHGERSSRCRFSGGEAVGISRQRAFYFHYANSEGYSRCVALSIFRQLAGFKSPDAKEKVHFGAAATSVIIADNASGSRATSDSYDQAHGDKGRNAYNQSPYFMVYFVYSASI
ncbi:hypothetical protein C8J56DRAFT_1067716 [Mycena floridula]|nr:hypothetical protein C8J56DRAFT_1067716 [Mycena floridula]